jgi:SAM-dependent methyltransferase
LKPGGLILQRQNLLYSLYKRSRMLPVVYWECKGRCQQFVARRRGLAFDNRFNVETEDGFGPFNLGLSPEIAAHALAYNPIDPARFKRVVDTLSIDPKAFSFIDVGSGKGRALFLAEQYGFKRILGVELSTKVHQIAERNLKRFQAHIGCASRIELHNCDALTLALPADPTIILMFNPFDLPVMTKFVAKIDRSLLDNPRDVYLIYVRPHGEAALQGSKCLQKMFEDRRMDNYVIYRTLPLA